MLIPLEELHAARERLRDHLPETPVKAAEGYARRRNAATLLKLELFHPTRAFKVRGALNALLTLSDAERERGVVCASAGNHGLGLSWAAARVGARAAVVLPESAPRERVEAVRAMGGEAIVHGPDWNAAAEEAESLAEERGMTMIPPFDHPAIMAGQGTLALELLEQHPEVEAVLCSIGGGGLIAGVASAIAQTRPDVRVYGVETDGADSMSQALREGKPVTLPRFGSIATSLGTRRSGLRQLAIVREAVQRVVVVPDREALDELEKLLDEDNLLVEPAASCTLAALMGPLAEELDGAAVASVMCGGNVTLRQVREWRAWFGREVTLGA